MQYFRITHETNFTAAKDGDWFRQGVIYRGVPNEDHVGTITIYANHGEDVRPIPNVPLSLLTPATEAEWKDQQERSTRPR